MFVSFMSGSSSGPGPRSKVEQLLEEYELEGVGEYLVDRWTAEDTTERLSLRALAREFNIRLLEAHLSVVNADPVKGTAKTYYEGLTNDEVSSGMRTQVKRTLEQAGITVDELKDEFVSRQAIHTYLTKTRNVKQTNTNSSISPSPVRETINRLRERTKQVTESKIQRLTSVGQITIGEFRVLVDIQVYCSDCGTQQSVSELLANAACDCPD